MKLNVAIIKVLFWITTISLIVTILLSFFNDCHGSWFVLWSCSISIGIFASSLVVLISEFVRYKHLKNEFESDLYYNLSLLYLKLKSIVYAINKSYQEPLPRLTSHFLKPQLTEIEEATNRAKQDIFQYYTVRENEVSKTAKTFALNTIPKLFNTIFALRDIEIAINKDILTAYQNNLDTFNHNKNGIGGKCVEQQNCIVASSPYTNETLQRILCLVDNGLFNSIESLLMAISNSKSNNFDWEKGKKQVLKLV